MLYDFDYTDPQNITPTYFRAKLENGILNVRDDDPAGIDPLL